MIYSYFKLKAAACCLLLFTALSAPAQNKVEGLELPPDREVNFNATAAIRIRAKTEADKVKFLVVGSLPDIRSKQTDPFTLTVEIPQRSATIFVYAITAKDGGLGEFARTVVLVRGEEAAAPAPDAGEKSEAGIPDLNRNVALTFITEKRGDAADLAVQGYRRSKAFQDWLTRGNHRVVVYNKDNEQDLASMKRRKLDLYVEKTGLPVLIVQDLETGVVIDTRKAPLDLRSFAEGVKSLTE